MFCRNCGQELPDGSNFCTGCGSKIGKAPMQTELLDRRQPHESYQQPPYQQYPNYGSEAPGKSYKGLIIGLIIAAAAVAAILIVIFLVRPPFISNLFGSASGSQSGTAEADGSYESSYESYSGGGAVYDDYDNYSIEYVSCDVSAYPNVKVYCRILDEYGNLVTLSDPQFSINEYNSSGRAIEKIVKRVNQLDGKEGLSISLIADKSYSMVNRMNDIKSVMSDFVSNLDYALGDRVEFLSFDSFVMYMCTLTNDVNLLKNGIYNMVPEGETAMYDALYEGLQSISLRGGARCVICFTDGDDNRSFYSSDDIARESRRLSIPVFIIGTDDADSYALTNLAESCGGKYWNVNSIFDVSQILDEIYGNEKYMYCIEYEADGALDQYAQRSVDIILNRDGSQTNCKTKADLNPIHTVAEERHPSRYELVVSDISWRDANQEALRKGGHLVTINSQDEMDLISGMAADADLKFVWMGGYTSVNNNQAFGHWVTGEDFNRYTAWFEGEPSRNDIDGTPEMYLMLWYVNDEWSWNDQRNDPVHETGLEYFKGKTGYVIEYEY